MANQEYVPPAEVLLGTQTRPTFYQIGKMVRVLKNQGQIEPLQVKRRLDGKFEIFPEDPWGPEIVLAARELGWPSLLVTVEARYQA